MPKKKNEKSKGKNPKLKSELQV